MSFFSIKKDTFEVLLQKLFPKYKNHGIKN